MSSKLFWICLLTIVAGASTQSENNNTETVNPRQGKVFSLFSVVQFKNSGCKSQSTMTSGQSTVRNGTCFTSSECSTKGGTASGNCAAGFGVCCLFLVTSTGATISQNCTYLRNPSFPSVYSATSSLSYTVNKCSTDICYLRLDFETFTTLGPADSVETAAHTCADQFKITTSTSQSIPTICGANTGQHIYVDIGNQATDSAALAFTFSATTSTIRIWEVKISQISCNNPNRPPNGCLQYWTTLTGRFTTFNFLTTTLSSHLPSQSYSACIRRAAGYCCVQYNVCEGLTDAFSLDRGVVIEGRVDSQCVLDYIAIPGSTQLTCSVSNSALSNKYCGSYLGFNAIAQGNQLVCDCTPPFEVYVRTDDQPDAAVVKYSRGNCLDFKQVPCGSV